jgi:hypothetical protein
VAFDCLFIRNQQTLLWVKLCFLAPFALVTSASGKDGREILTDATWKQELSSVIAEACATTNASGTEIVASQIQALFENAPSGCAALEPAVSQLSARSSVAPLFSIKVVVVEPGQIDTGFGDVVADGLLKRSGRGAYAKLTQAGPRPEGRLRTRGRGTHPSVIAPGVSKAVKERKPRTRYVAGKYAKPMIVTRNWLGDRPFDRVIMSQMR